VGITYYFLFQKLTVMFQRSVQKILIVDDEPANLFILEGILSGEGYDVVSASNGKECLEYLHSQEFDIVLLDIMMPEMTGLDVLENMRKSAALHNLPVMVVSAKVSSDDVKEALDAGANEYIKKPIDEIELLARIRTLLRMKMQDDELRTLNKQLESKHRLISNNIEYAYKIQSAMLPKAEMFANNFSDYFIFFKPRDIISGDFYWCFAEGQKRFVVEADCTGHGVAGALLSVIGGILLNKIVIQQGCSDAALILNKLNEEFIVQLNQHFVEEKDFLSDGMDVSVAVIDYDEGAVEFASASQTIICIKRNKSIEIVDGDDFPIGYELEVLLGVDVNFKKQRYDLDDVESFIFFSDGIIDQLGGDKKSKFLLKRFVAVLKENIDLEFADLHAKIRSAFADWRKDMGQTDDVVVLGIKL